jgi:hypothetical protein
MRPVDRMGWGPTYEVVQHDPNRFEIRVTANKMFIPDATPNSVILTTDQYHRWQRWRTGPGLIQDLLHDLSPTQREILMSGLRDL